MNALELARAARDPEFVPGEPVDALTVAEAIAGYEVDLTPLYMTDPVLVDRKRRDPGGAAAKIDEALCAIGAKLASRMPEGRVNAWRDAVLVSLSKWPATVALAAARAGRHESYKYGLDDVDARLHELAAEIDHRHREALAKLKRMRAEIERAARPAPAIEQQPFEWTAAAVEEANEAFRKVGVRTRYRLTDNGLEDYLAPPDVEGLAPHEGEGYMGEPEGNTEKD